MRSVALILSLVVSAAVVFADEHTVDFDHHTDFRTLKTFGMHEGKVDSPQPELNNPLLLRKIGDAIRSELKAKGLKETVNSPDIVVTYSITSEDFADRRGGPPAFSQGTLVIDFLKRDSNAMVWRSVYRDDESNNSKLSQKLPGDVRKSLSEYPPRQKGVIEPASATLVTKQSPTPRATAQAAMEIIRAAREDANLVGHASHPGLEANLNGLERAARDASRSSGTAQMKALIKAIQDTAETADSIADRPNESRDSKAKLRDLAEKLRALLKP